MTTVETVEAAPSQAMVDDTDDTGTPCRICGCLDFTPRSVTIDERSGQRPESRGAMWGGLAATVFGVVCLILGVALAADPLPAQVSGGVRAPLYYIALGGIILLAGASTLWRYFGAKKVEVTRSACRACGLELDESGETVEVVFPPEFPVRPVVSRCSGCENPVHGVAVTLEQIQKRDALLIVKQVGWQCRECGSTYCDADCRKRVLGHKLLKGWEAVRCASCQASMADPGAILDGPAFREALDSN